MEGKDLSPYAVDRPMESYFSMPIFVNWGKIGHHTVGFSKGPDHSHDLEDLTPPSSKGKWKVKDAVSGMGIYQGIYYIYSPYVNIDKMACAILIGTKPYLLS